MESNGEPLRSRNGCIVRALAGILLSIGVALLQEPLLSLVPIKAPRDTIAILLPLVYAYFLLLNPLTCYLNMLSVFLLLVKPHAGAAKTSLSVFLIKQLPRAARAVSLVNLLFCTPLWVQAAINEGSIGLAVGALLLCIALVSVLTSAFKKLLLACCHAGRSYVPGLFSLCISSQILILFDPLVGHSNTNQNDSLSGVVFNSLFLFLVFVISMLGITLLVLCISIPAERFQATTQAEHSAIVALSVAFASLFVGVYMKVFVAAAADMLMPVLGVKV